MKVHPMPPEPARKRTIGLDRDRPGDVRRLHRPERLPAQGKTVKSGEMNFPFNLAAVLSGDGLRVSLTVGWNVME